MLRHHLAALSFVLGLATSSRAADMLDLIPADALAGCACRSIEGLVQKTTKLAKDVDRSIAREALRPAVDYVGSVESWRGGVQADSLCRVRLEF